MIHLIAKSPSKWNELFDSFVFRITINDPIFCDDEISEPPPEPTGMANAVLGISPPTSFIHSHGFDFVQIFIINFKECFKEFLIYYIL